MPASVCRGRAKPRLRVSRRSRHRLATALRPGTASLYINRGRYVHAILCPRPCVAACRGRATHGEAACPRFAALRGRAGTASLYINRGRYVHAILCPRPCVAAEPQPPPRVCRTRQSRVSACRGEAALRLIDPRKLYSILRPRSINRLID